MFTVLLIMIAGIAAGFLLRKKKNFAKYTDIIIVWLIYILLFLLGVSVGANKVILNNLDNLGFKALLLSVGAVSGSVFISFFVYKHFFKNDKKNINA